MQMQSISFNGHLSNSAERCQYHLLTVLLAVINIVDILACSHPPTGVLIRFIISRINIEPFFYMQIKSFKVKGAQHYSLDFRDTETAFSSTLKSSKVHVQHQPKAPDFMPESPGEHVPSLSFNPQY